MKTDINKALEDLMRIALFLLVVALAVFFATGCGRPSQTPLVEPPPIRHPTYYVQPATCQECLNGGTVLIEKNGVETTIVGISCNEPLPEQKLTLHEPINCEQEW